MKKHFASFFSCTLLHVGKRVNLKTSKANFLLVSFCRPLCDEAEGCAHDNVTHLHNRAHVCCVSDVFGAHGMERNIGDQLNKAFEAYRQVSIEKDNAKKQLQQMVKKNKQKQKQKNKQKVARGKCDKRESQVHKFRDCTKLTALCFFFFCSCFFRAD